jgi:hypothetical protein
MIIRDFDLVSVALAEFETNPPAFVDRHCPLSSPVALEFVKSHAFQRTEITERFSDVQRQQQIDRGFEIQSSKLVRVLAVPNLRAAEFRQDLIMADTYYETR